MFTSEELNPVRGSAESKEAYRARRASVDRRVSEYLRTGRKLWAGGTFRPGRNAAKRAKKQARFAR